MSTSNWRGVVIAAIVIGLVAYVACSREARGQPTSPAVRTAVGHIGPAQAITPTATVTATLATTATATVAVTATAEPTATPGRTLLLYEPPQPDGICDVLYAPIQDDGSWGDWQPFVYLGGGMSGGRELPPGRWVVYAACGVPAPLPTEEPTPTTAPPTQTPWVVHVVVTATPEPVRPRSWLPIVLRPRVRR